MGNFNDPYIIISLLSSVAIFAMALGLMAFTKPRDSRLRNYYFSRLLLAFAYVILAAVGIWEIIDNSANKDSSVLLAFTLIAASFQAFFFTFSLITLINIHYLTSRRFIYNLSSILLGSVLLLLSLFVNACYKYFFIMFYVLLCFYCGQLVYYVILFNREYNQCVKQLDNFFSEDEQKRLSWIKTAFYMAFSIGVIAIISLFVPIWIYFIFSTLYTVFYIYYAMKYINYINIFHYISPVFEPSNKENHNANNNKSLDILIISWVEHKGFTTPGITLDNLAIEFMTNRTYLSSYINQNMNKNFKTWIGELRIEEAKNLILAHPEITIAEIGERVGFSERVSFYRQFVKVTGKTPQKFRMNKTNLN